MFYDDDDEDDEDDYYNRSGDVKNLPIFKKGEEIRDVVSLLADLFPEDDEQLQFLKDEMLSNAHLLTVKIVGAEATELYDLKMEAATFIRKAACDLMVMNHSLAAFGFENVDYFQIVRQLIEEYRLLFIDWVAGFDKWSYIIDRWGLFNPPGIGPFDYPEF
ncbi:MAG: hypothetical protein LBT94_10345 [Prevotellaceae bacterium]|jgi:hypothetical protein|nr:hypothetical protein [Prevotellaceae bacterium]